MAIPHRTTITCPACGISDTRTIADTSVGPRGRVSRTPIYRMFGGDMWAVTRRGGQQYISCRTCGCTEFTTVAEQARQRPAPRPKLKRRAP